MERKKNGVWQKKCRKCQRAASKRSWNKKKLKNEIKLLTLP